METSPADAVRIGNATTVPLRRLGALLRLARTEADLSVADVARRGDGTYDLADLADIEAGRRPLDDDEVVSLLALYQADPGDLLASRSTLVIDLHEGTVAAGPWSASFSPDADGPDDVLARYLALLYTMRDLPVGTAIPLRTLDISVLAGALALPEDDVHERLTVLMDPADGRVDRFRALFSRRVLVPAAGLVVAVTGIGVLTLVQQDSASAPGVEIGRTVAAVAVTPLPAVDGLQIEAPPRPAPPGADDPEIGEGLTIEAPPQVAPPGADDAEIGEALTVERSD